jgi:hypothetical protein
MKLRPARAKIIAELFETLMAILHSLDHRCRLLRLNSRYLTSSVGLRYVAVTVVSSA